MCQLINKLFLGFFIFSISLLAACGGGGGDGGEGAEGDQQNLAQIDARFAAPTAGPLDVVYECRRANSGLTYYMYLRPDGGLDWQFETDTYQTFRFTGMYSFANGMVQVQITDPGFPLDETLGVLSSHLGIVYQIQSQTMDCGAVGHGYDEQISNSVRHYQCPMVSQGPGSDVENAIELGSYSLGGSIFRQRDIWPAGSATQLVRRGSGIYRRVGDTIYAYFGQAFDDFNVLTGTLLNGDLRLQVNELGNAGICDRT